jgi:hypothetical protein
VGKQTQAPAGIGSVELAQAVRRRTADPITPQELARGSSSNASLSAGRTAASSYPLGVSIGGSLRPLDGA